MFTCLPGTGESVTASDNPQELPSQAAPEMPLSSLPATRDGASLEHSSTHSEGLIVSDRSTCVEGAKEERRSSALRRKPARIAAVNSIELAYDWIHYIEVILTFLRTTEPGNLAIRPILIEVGPIFDESRHTYVQALSRHILGDFDGACALSSASADLCQAAGLLLAEAVRPDSALACLQQFVECRWAQPEPDYAEIEGLLSRVSWLARFGGLSSEGREQVLKLESWGAAFLKRAERLGRNGAKEELAPSWRTAFALARAAEHVCERWYASRGEN